MNNSLSAYFDESNQRKFKSQKAQIVRLLTSNPNHSRFYVGKMLGISDHAAQKRLSDLLTEGTIFVSGERKHGYNTISLYSIVQQLELYPGEKKPTLIKFLKDEHPDIFHKYNALYNHKL
jgi:predicted ArsR family transcriptional regulator